jgi:Ribosomal protein L16p/L10e
VQEEGTHLLNFFATEFASPSYGRFALIAVSYVAVQRRRRSLKVSLLLLAVQHMSFVHSLFAPLRSSFTPSLVFSNVQARGAAQLAPKAVKYMKRHKGKLPVPIGGSTKGTVLAYGYYGIRIQGNGMRFSAKQLTTAQEVLKRKLKSIKHAKVYLRLFPDIPVCVKVYHNTSDITSR